MAAARAVKASETQSWDAFWAEVGAGGRTTTIRGVEVPVPTDLPLSLQRRLAELRDSERDEDVRELVGMIFGDGVMDAWLDAGMGSREFQVVLAWGLANGGGAETSFAEALEIVERAEAEGKAASGQPNRAARRAATKPRSSAGGGPSKRTSPASTGSGRTTSRA